MKKTLFFAAFSLFFAAFGQAQTAEEIIAKHIAATGGADKWAKVTTMKSDAKISADGAPNMTIEMSMTVVRDKALRMDVAVMGMTQSSAISGDQGWSTNPFAGKTEPERVAGIECSRIANRASVGPDGQRIATFEDSPGIKLYQTCPEGN